jgi:cysteine synthase B
MPMQYENPNNPGAHEAGTGPELLEQLGHIDTFVAGLGTGGTLTGVGRVLRAAHPDVTIVAAEPLPGDSVMGLRSLEDGYVPPVLDTSMLDRRVLVSNADSVRGMRRLADAGIFAGVSAGGIFHVACRVAKDAPEGATIATIVPDSGWKYLSAGLWTRDLDELEDDLERGHWW